MSEWIRDVAVASARRMIEVRERSTSLVLEQGAEAELIVVGRRGLGGFKSPLLGSVGQQVVHHATCPVGGV